MFFLRARAFVCGVGAGFDQLSVGIKYLGERAPTDIMQKRDRKLKSGHGAGFLGCLFAGTDMGERAPTEIMQKRDRVDSLILEKPRETRFL
jgi:hypothetical protein